MTRTMLMLVAALCVSTAALPLPAQPAQSALPELLDARPKTHKPAAVAYLFPEQINIAAGKPVAVDLHFKVADGLHINSNKPHAVELIPTTLDLPGSSGIRLADATFPPGKDFSFPVNPEEKLSVYTGEFVIHAHLVATPGDHLVQAILHYQACNNEQCMPPHSIPVAIDVIAK